MMTTTTTIIPTHEALMTAMIGPLGDYYRVPADRADIYVDIVAKTIDSLYREDDGTVIVDDVAMAVRDVLWNSFPGGSTAKLVSREIMTNLNLPHTESIIAD